MNRRSFSLLAGAVLVPVLLRFAWFFPGFSLPRSIPTPDYGALKMPQAPLSTPSAAEAKSSPGTVVIDYAHSNQFQLADIQSLTAALTARDGTYVLNGDTDDLAAQLKGASAYVVISPTDAFAPADIAQVQAFVARGGRLVVFTDATRGSVQYDFLGNPISNQQDVETTEPLLEAFGITANADYLYDLAHNEGNFRNVFLSAAGTSDLTSGVGKVTFYGTHSLTTLTGSLLLVGGESTLSSSTDAVPEDSPAKRWAAAVLSKDEHVLALGDFTFLTAPYDGVADNQLLIDHIADFLLTPRDASLADFPHVFRSPQVKLFVSPDLQMTAELTDAISQLQAALAEAGIQIELVQQAPQAGDVLVLGSYAPADELAPYTKPFGLQADDYGSYVTVKPFGRLGQSGNGLMLLKGGPSGTTLVLLAASVDDLTSLIEEVRSGDLSGCLVQGNVAACSIGYGGSFYDATPTPEPIPTDSAGG